MLTSLLRRVAGLPNALLYLITGVLTFGESAALMDLVVPGEVGLVFVAAALETAGGSPWWAGAIAAIGAVLGDSTGYWIGRKIGIDAVLRWRWARRHASGPLRRTKEYFGDRGGLAVFGGRFVGAMRALVPVVAGGAGMPFPRFLLFSVPAATLWACGVFALGYVLGSEVARFFDRYAWIVSAVVITGLGAWWLYRRRRSES